MTHIFEPGVPYKFTPCMNGAKSFIAVAAIRHDDRRGVEFVLPCDLIAGVPTILDGREIMKVNVDGLDYCASAAAPLDLSVTFDLLDQIKRTRGGKR